MTKQATLSPMELSVNTPLNPIIPKQGGTNFSGQCWGSKGYLDDNISDELQFNRPFKPGEINAALLSESVCRKALWEGQIIL